MYRCKSVHCKPCISTLKFRIVISVSSRGIYETERVFKGMKDQFNSIFVLNIAQSIKILQQSFFICNRHPII